jgi:hypothetical protein
LASLFPATPLHLPFLQKSTRRGDAKTSLAETLPVITAETSTTNAIYRASHESHPS